MALWYSNVTVNGVIQLDNNNAPNGGKNTRSETRAMRSIPCNAPQKDHKVVETHGR